MRATAGAAAVKASSSYRGPAAPGPDNGRSRPHEMDMEGMGSQAASLLYIVVMIAVVVAVDSRF